MLHVWGRRTGVSGLSNGVQGVRMGFESGNRDEAVETLLRLKMAGEGSDDWEQLLGGG